MTQEDGSAPVPGWMKERQLQKAADDRKVTEMSQKQSDASKLVREGGREFWLQLLDRLKFNTDSLPALGEELYGSTSPWAIQRARARLAVTSKWTGGQ
jgi:hypothetical protein